MTGAVRARRLPSQRAEVALRPRGPAHRGVARGELLGAGDDEPFEVRAMLLELGVARLDAGEHLVERVGEHAKLVVAHATRTDREILGRTHATGGVGERVAD